MVVNTVILAKIRCYMKTYYVKRRT